VGDIHVRDATANTATWNIVKTAFLTSSNATDHSVLKKPFHLLHKFVIKAGFAFSALHRPKCNVKQTIGSEMAVRLSVLRGGRALRQERSSGTHFCYTMSKPQGHGATEGMR
jgi:hypothetical protein